MGIQDPAVKRQLDSFWVVCLEVHMADVMCLQASSKDTGQLFAALHHRSLALRSRADQEPEVRVPMPEVTCCHEEDSDEENQHGSSTATAAAPAPTPAPASGMCCRKEANLTCRHPNYRQHIWWFTGKPFEPICEFMFSPSFVLVGRLYSSVEMQLCYIAIGSRSTTVMLYSHKIQVHYCYVI